MGRRQTSVERERRREKNASKRTRQSPISPSWVLGAKAKELDAEKKRKEQEEAFYQIVEEVRASFHGDSVVRYCNLVASTKAQGERMMKEIEEKTRVWASLPKEQQTPAVIAQASAEITAMNNRWIQSGLLSAAPVLKPFALPTGRVMTDGMVYAIDRYSDEDIHQMGIMLNQKFSA